MKIRDVGFNMRVSCRSNTSFRQRVVDPIRAVEFQNFSSSYSRDASVSHTADAFGSRQQVLSSNETTIVNDQALTRYSDSRQKDIAFDGRKSIGRTATRFEFTTKNDRPIDLAQTDWMVWEQQTSQFLLQMVF